MAARPARWNTDWRATWRVRYAQRRCCERSLPTTCADFAGADTGARVHRTSDWRSFWGRARWAGIRHDNYSGRTAGGRCPLCCRATLGLPCDEQARRFRNLWPPLYLCNRREEMLHREVATTSLRLPCSGCSAQGRDPGTHAHIFPRPLSVFAEVPDRIPGYNPLPTQYPTCP